MKKILVLGGSYFLGRVFTRQACRLPDFELHLVNRGNYPLKVEGIRQYVCDRHDGAKLKDVLPSNDWDVVIDFCAYEPGDIATAIEDIPGAIGQYIYISTSSVYDPAAPSPKAENAPMIAEDSDDPGLHYAYNKRILELEARAACAGKGAALTIIRPSFIYGPFNYAPREQFYFNCLLENQAIPVPMDATGRFQFVYVRDAVQALIACLANPETYGEAYNLAAPDVIDYPVFMEVLERVHGKPLATQPLTVADVMGMNIPVPFPLAGDELFDGSKATDHLKLRYTPFEEGMKEAYAVHMAAHAP